MALFDFSLTSEEMSIIDSLDRGQFLNYIPIRHWHDFQNPFGIGRDSKLNRGR